MSEEAYTVEYAEIDGARQADFLARGVKGRQFFPHRIHHLPKCGPDGFKLAQRMCGARSPSSLSELVLYATPDLASEFPRDLWFDDDLIWHQQQFGLDGQLATANLCWRGQDLYSMVHVSDAVQRISRRPLEKSRLENRFKGWPVMLLNAILVCAAAEGVSRVLVARSGWAMEHTDPRRTVQPAMFQRIYDRPLGRFITEASEHWWVIDVERNRDRLVFPELRIEERPEEKIICICHDVERGLGHLDSDPGFAAQAEETAPQYLAEMARIERELGISASYNVVGQLFDEVAPQLRDWGHELAFHSYDHVIGDEQLARCRAVDYRLKGYRPPQSRITPELTDEALSFHNFEWIASSAYSLGFDQPLVENGIVRIPIHFDDYAMYYEGLSFDRWRAQALETIASSRFVAFGLHDCYAQYWLTQYVDFLEDIKGMGDIRSMNQVSAEALMRNSLCAGGLVWEAAAVASAVVPQRG